MILTLEVVGPHAAKLGPAHRKIFRTEGGTIGRLPDNDWVLSDPYVSSHHARIKYKGNAFYIEDTSRNGVFINESRLVPNQPQALTSGDSIFIEPYEIRASITGVSTESPGGLDADPFRVENPFDNLPAPARGPVIPPLPGAFVEPAVSGVVDPLEALGLAPPSPPPPQPVPRAADLPRGSVLQDHYRAPAIKAPPPVAAPVANEGGIPLDYNPLDSQYVPRPDVPRPAPPPTPDPVPRAPAPPPASPRATPPASRRTPPDTGSDDVGLGVVLAGAGIEGVRVTPELARNFGQILRVVVSGVMDVLQARQRIKEEFRMRMTTIQPRENNPLKVSANVEDALHNLLVKRNPAYLEPVRAFEDAFDDVRNHQMAMLAGVRAAFESMLAEFDPDHLEQEFDRQPRKGALIPMPGKPRYWELYREKVDGILKDADASFRRLFGDEFARAYEEQLARLRGRDRGESR